MATIISFHTYHDANIVVAVDGRVRLVFECERFFQQRYFAFPQEPEPFRDQVVEALAEVYRLTGLDRFDLCVFNWQSDEQKRVLRETVAASRFLETSHHRAHAAGTYFLSPFDECLIFSMDGGGNDGWFNVYEGKRRKVKLLKRLDLNLGSPYRMLGNFITEIRSRKGFEMRKGLDIAGKLMGLAAYGRPDDKLYHAARRALLSFTKPEDLRAFADEVGIPFAPDVLDEQTGRDLAHNIQRAVEDIIEEIFEENRKLSDSHNVCLTGGVALNVLSNSRLAAKYKDYRFWVPPNPNDCGIALGSICDLFPDVGPGETAWNGVPLLDVDSIGQYEARFDHRPATLAELADLLHAGKIIGVVQGRSEHGPRALGNRSILTSPSFPGIKDILNKKVKYREPYRPFAPIVAVEDRDRYFDLPELSPYMSFSADVKPEYRDVLEGITHADGTARVQTLRREDNPFIYDLLREFEARSGLPVLLNTSLNIKGKPIVARLSEAFEILETTELDLLYYDGRLFELRREAGMVDLATTGGVDLAAAGSAP